MEENAILQSQADKYMMFLLVIAMESSLLHCSTDVFSKVNETRIKLVSSYPSGHVEVRCPRGKKKHISDSLLLRRFVFRMPEASAKRVTGDEPQGTMGRVQTAGERLPHLVSFSCQKSSFSWHGPIFGLFKSWKRSILVAYCCKHCKL